jgi:hypothetical protein
MPRPKRDYKRVVYAESSSSSTSANPQVPSVSVVPPLVIRVRPESPRFFPAAGRSGFVRPPSRSQAGSVVPPVAGRSGPVRPAARNKAGVGVPLRVPVGGRSGPFVVESFVRPSSPVRSAFRPFVSTVVPQPPPASPSERGQTVGSMPALAPIWPPTLVAGRSSGDGFRSPLVSSQGSSSPSEPYDFETQHSLEANYLATLLTSKNPNRFIVFSVFFLFFFLMYIALLLFFLFLGYTTQERIAGYYTFRRDMDEENNLYDWNRLAFGLTNTPGTFQRLMNFVLHSVIGKNCLVYLDDIIVFSRSKEEHLTNLEQIFNLLKEANLKLGLSKCKFVCESVQYLGHVISVNGILPDPGKVEFLKNVKRPTTITEIQSFLGLASYYRRIIRNFANIAHPLIELTRKKES